MVSPPLVQYEPLIDVAFFIGLGVQLAALTMYAAGRANPSASPLARTALQVSMGSLIATAAGNALMSLLTATGIIPFTLDPNTSGVMPINLSVVATLMAGLAPTLMIVRVAYGRSVDSAQTVVSIRFAERETQLASSTSGTRGTTDIYSGTGVRTLEFGDTQEGKSEGRVGEYWAV
ncbi:hypothetical protein PQX77_012510 [Marasmius sp. AFHP31]|nr:hypothetical protein PQX77_012510 [Marasmius sp. AFHP31]